MHSLSFDAKQLTRLHQVSLRFWFVLGLGTIVAVTLYRCHEADFTNSTKKKLFPVEGGEERWRLGISQNIGKTFSVHILPITKIYLKL